MNFEDFKSIVLSISRERSQLSQHKMILTLFEDVINMDQESAKIDYRKKCKEELTHMVNTINAGYGGIDLNGNFVDRRFNTSAIPLKENEMLYIPKPREI